MTDDLLSSHETRRVRLATRRKRLRIVGAVVVVALIAGGIGTAAALHNKDKSSAATSTPRAHQPVDPPKTVGLGKAGKLAPPRIVTHDKPLQLWIGGDSLAGSFGPALGQVAGATGVVDTTIDYKVSSGLADNGIRNWYEHAQQKMSSDNPDAVVFIIGTNDASIVNSQDSNNDGVPDWQVRYGQKIDEMMATFVGGDRHRTVFWLGPPTLRDHTLAKGAVKLGEFMKHEAAKFAPDVVYVDTYGLFSDKYGDYSESLPDTTGEIVQMRISDGIHFTVDGAKYLANAIWKLLDKRWDVTAHADPSQPISYTIVGGGDYVPGVGYYRPHGYGSSSTTVPDTTATTTGGTTVTTGPPTTVHSPSTTVAPTTTPKTTPTTKPKVTPTTGSGSHLSAG